MKTYRLLALATAVLGVSYFIYSAQKHLTSAHAEPSVAVAHKAIISVAPIYNPQAHNTQTINGMQAADHSNTEQDTTEDKLALFTLKNNNIHHDEYGNNIVDVSTEGFNSKEFITSNTQIFYPTEEQLNNGINGCGMGGYYVELNAQLTLIVKNDSGTNIYPYLCTHNTQDNTYAFIATENNTSTEKTIAAILNTP